MLYSIIIVIAIPIILGIIVVSPLEPPAIEDEQNQETSVDEIPETSGIIFILLAIIWFIFFSIILKTLITGRYRHNVRKEKG